MKSKTNKYKKGKPVYKFEGKAKSVTKLSSSKLTEKIMISKHSTY